MNSEELQKLAEEKIGDLTQILLLAEKRRKATGKLGESTPNRLAWNLNLIDSAKAVRHIAAQTGVALSPKTQALLLDSLQCAYRQSKCGRDNNVLCQPPRRPEVMEEYRASSVQALWCKNAISAAVALIDEATIQATSKWSISPQNNQASEQSTSILRNLSVTKGGNKIEL